MTKRQNPYLVTFLSSLLALNALGQTLTPDLELQMNQELTEKKQQTLEKYKLKMANKQIQRDQKAERKAFSQRLKLEKFRKQAAAMGLKIQ